MNPHWQAIWTDIALLAYIGWFGLICAVLIIKESRLGWAMFVKCVAYCTAFNYGALILLFPKFANEDVRRAIRIFVAVAITWATFELILRRVQRWWERSNDRAERT